MILAKEAELNTLPVNEASFFADPFSFLDNARRDHPWLARFSGGYVVYGHRAVSDLLMDDENLNSGFGPLIEFYSLQGTKWAQFMEEILNGKSGAAHARMRSSVARAFTPRRANQEREMMRRVVNDLLDEWAPKGAFDFTDFASYFPITVMCGLLGVSTDPIPALRVALENQLKSLSLDMAMRPLILEGWDAMWAFADGAVNAREAAGDLNEEFLLDSLIQTKNEGGLTEDELRFMLLALVLAGYDTSKNQLGVTMKLLLDHPEMYERCAVDLDFCGKVIDESLRHSAIATPFRDASRDFTYDGVQFSKGDVLVMALPLANRDPDKFADAEAFNPERADRGRHVAFGRGAHICLGQFLAKTQLQEGLHLITQRIKHPRLTGELQWKPFLGAWGLDALPITFDPA